MKSLLFRPQGAMLYLACGLPLFVFYAVGLRQSGAANATQALFYAATYLAPGIAIGALVWRAARRLT